MFADEADERSRSLGLDEAEPYHFDEDEIPDDVVECVVSRQEMTLSTRTGIYRATKAKR